MQRQTTYQFHHTNPQYGANDKYHKPSLLHHCAACLSADLGTLGHALPELPLIASSHISASLPRQDWDSFGRKGPDCQRCQDTYRNPKTKLGITRDTCHFQPSFYSPASTMQTHPSSL